MQTPPTIACCLCAKPTPSDQCVDGRCIICLAATVDITTGIDRECEIEMCMACEQDGSCRWFRNPQWVLADLESAELLALCVRRVRGLKEVRLVDASWIWQEPHSRRLKLKLTVSRDVLTSRSLQQSFVVEFVVKTRHCTVCTQNASRDPWQSKVQLRQRCDYPRTLLAMEVEMRRRQQGLRVAYQLERTKEGLDFTFLRRQHAQRFVHLLHSIAPCRTKASQALIASNAKTGTSNVKYTWAVEVAPCCRGDLVLLPKALTNGAAGLGRWCLVSAVGASLHLVDPIAGQSLEVGADAYWRHPFEPLATRAQLTTYVVLDIEEAEAVARAGGTRSGGGVVADATVARERDLGTNDHTALIRTHLVGKLESGDEALGYDLESMTHVEGAEGGPPAILVEKKVERVKARARRAGAVARRRRRREGGADDRSSCSTTSYQTELGDVLEDTGGADDEGDELAAMGAAMGEAFAPELALFARDLEEPGGDDHGDDDDCEEDEPPRAEAVVGRAMSAVATISVGVESVAIGST